MRKKILAILLCVCMVMSLAPAALAVDTVFGDVAADAWYADEVKWAYDEGLMNGTGDGAFSPALTTTRGMIVTILWRMEGEPEAEGEQFTDVAADAYYAKAIQWASANKIVEGYGAGLFGPGDEITREQLATIMYRYAQYKEIDVSEKADLSAYADADTVHAWAKDSMAWAVAAGLISGMTEDTLAPTGAATRAQVAVILYRLNDEVISGGEEEPEEPSTPSYPIHFHSWNDWTPIHFHSWNDWTPNNDGTHTGTCSCTVTKTEDCTIENNVCTKCGASYPTTASSLQDALNKGGYIQLSENITTEVSLSVPEGVAVTLYLNGKTISNDSGYVLENKGDLTIDGNGTLTGLGIIRSTAGKVTVNSGNFYASSRWQDKIYQHTLKAENTEVVINGGNFDATEKGQTNAVLNATTNSTITINGGIFKNVDGDLGNFDPYLFTYENNGGKVIINDGTFYGGWRFNGETATTDIYGGNFTVGFDGQSFRADSTHVLTVYGGTFVSQTHAKLTTKLDDFVDDESRITTDAETGTKTVTKLTVIDGILYDGTTLYKVPADYAGTTVSIAEGTTALANGVFAGTNVTEVTVPASVTDFGATGVSETGASGGAFKGSDVTTVVLEEGMTEIPAATFNGAKNLTSVNIPASVKTIGINAFRQTALNGLTIPETVTTIKNGAFRDMTSLITVTVEGNVNFENYAFRSVPNLTSIYLLGDDVTFNGSQFATRSDNGDATGITIYVKNATVAARVNAAQSSARGYEVKILGDETDGSDASEVTLVKNTAQLAEAIGAGKTTIALSAGEITLPNVKSKNITLVGVGPETVVDYSHMGNYQEVSGSSFVFKNMTVKCAEIGYPYPGLQHTTSVSYEDCHIEGTVNLFCPATFTNCTFDSKSAEHNVVTYGSDSVTFTDCKFTYGDRAVNCYAEGASARDVAVTFTDCTFTKVAGKETTGAIETNSSLMKSLTLTINNCTVNEGELWFISGWDSKDGAKTTVTVDGVESMGVVLVQSGDATGHAIGINGWEGTIDNGDENVIESFKGNTITVNSTTNTKRAAFKVWDDETYASDDDDTNVINATAQAFIDAVPADGSNTFNIIGYDHTIFSFYNVNTNN